MCGCGSTTSGARWPDTINPAGGTRPARHHLPGQLVGDRRAHAVAEEHERRVDELGEDVGELTDERRDPVVGQVGDPPLTPGEQRRPQLDGWRQPCRPRTEHRRRAAGERNTTSCTSGAVRPRSTVNQGRLTARRRRGRGGRAPRRPRRERQASSTRSRRRRDPRPRRSACRPRHGCDHRERRPSGSGPVRSRRPPVAERAIRLDGHRVTDRQAFAASHSRRRSTAAGVGGPVGRAATRPTTCREIRRAGIGADPPLETRSTRFPTATSAFVPSASTSCRPAGTSTSGTKSRGIWNVARSSSSVSWATSRSRALVRLDEEEIVG